MDSAQDRYEWKLPPTGAKEMVPSSQLEMLLEMPVWMLRGTGDRIDFILLPCFVSGPHLTHPELRISRRLTS